jgi:hypothetical protein
LDRPPTYFGGVAPEEEAIAELLLPSAGAAGAAVELLPSAGAAGAVAAGGDAGAAGGVFSVLLQAVSASAAAKTLRPSFVFIDESPKLFEKKRCGCEFVERKTMLSGAVTPEARIL